MKKSIFITGHNGMVGSNLLSYFKNKYNCLTIDRKKLDLRDEDKLNFYLKKKKTRYYSTCCSKGWWDSVK